MIYLGNKILVVVSVLFSFSLHFTKCIAQDCYSDLKGVVIKQNKDHLLVDVKYLENYDASTIIWLSDSSVIINSIRIDIPIQRFFFENIEHSQHEFLEGENYIFIVKNSCGTKRVTLVEYFPSKRFLDYIRHIESSKNEYMSDCNDVMECLRVDCFFMCPKKRK